MNAFGLRGSLFCFLALLAALVLLPTAAFCASPDWQWSVAFENTRNSDPNIPLGRRGSAIAYDPPRNRLVVFGGRSGARDEFFQDTWEFSLDTNRWRQISPGTGGGTSPSARAYMVYGLWASAPDGGGFLVVAMGKGADDALYDDVWAFDFNLDVWEELIASNDGPSRRYGASGGIYPFTTGGGGVSNRLYVSHGEGSDHLEQDTYYFDLAELRWVDATPHETWLRGTNYPTARAFAAGAMTKPNEVSLFGGCAEHEGMCPMQDAWYSNGKRSDWTQIGSWEWPFFHRGPASRASASMVALGRSDVFVFGGVDSWGNELSDTAVLDVAGGRWDRVHSDDHPSARKDPSMCVVARQDGTVVAALFGGNSRNDVWLLQDVSGVSNEDNIRPYVFPWTAVVFPVVVALPLVFIAVGTCIGCVLRVPARGLLRYTGVGVFRSVLHRRMVYTPETSFKGFHLVRWLTDYTVAEVAVIACYMAYSAAWVALIVAVRPSQRAFRAAGWLSMVNLGTMLFPVARNSVWTVAFGVSWERMLKLHRQLGRWTLLVITVHFAGMFGYYREELFDWSFFAYRPLFGFGAWLVILGMAAMGISGFRRQSWELFYWTHQAGLPLVVLFVALHNINSVLFLAPGLLLYTFDRLWRMARGQRLVRMKVADNSSLPGGVTKLKLKASSHFTYTPGQYVLLNVGKISTMQWHPFSVCSAPHQRFVNVLVQACPEGWTAELLALEDVVGVKVDGPYGGLSIAPSDYRVCLLMGAGVGVTPVASLLSHLLHKQRKGALPCEQVHFVWTVRHVHHLSWFESLLRKCEAAENFHMHLYVTRDDEEDEPPSFRVNYGRPSPRKIIRRIKYKNPQGFPMGVFASGPPGFTVGVQRAVWKEGWNPLKRIDIHRETFEW